MTAKAVVWGVAALGAVLVASTVFDLARRLLTYGVVAAIAFAAGRLGARRAAVSDDGGEH